MHWSWGWGYVEHTQNLKRIPLKILPPSNSQNKKINLSFKRTQEEKTALKKNFKKMLKSDEFTKSPQVNYTQEKISPVKGSTTFRIDNNTPAKIESDFWFGGGNVHFRTKATNMEKVSKLFEEIDDDLVPHADDEGDIILESQDILEKDTEVEI